MIRPTFIFLGALGVAAAAGCYASPNADLSPATQGPNGDGSRSKRPNVSGAPGEGLPCDVARVLAASCTRCHGAPLAHGAPNPLLTYDDLVAPSESDPTKTVAAASLERMKASKAPMPPGGKVDAADIAVLESWVNAGSMRGECGGPTNTDGGPDGAAKGDGGSKPDASSDAATAPSVCTSAATWTQGLTPSPLMHPGKACITCHSSSMGPAFAIAGTVYPTLHEPDDCNGIGAISVLIIDATGKTHTLPVNASGNFTRVTSVPMPYRAMVVAGGKVREMKTAQTNGDCNGCHTEAGNQSPGRVMAP